MSDTPQYPSLKEFLKAAIAEKISPAQIDAILDSIEEGLALSERDKAFAEYLESTGAPALPESDSQYNLGYADGFFKGYKEGSGGIEANAPNDESTRS